MQYCTELTVASLLIYPPRGSAGSDKAREFIRYDPTLFTVPCPTLLKRAEVALPDAIAGTARSNAPPTPWIWPLAA